MESNVYNGTKTDFSYFVRMALQKNIPWKSLSMILKDLAPTFHEAREIICILLKELEALHLTLQKKEKKLAKYKNCGSTFKTQGINFENQKKTLETETMTDDIQENEEQILVLENETIEDEIEVLEIVQESMNKDILLDLNEDTKLSDTLVNNDNDEHDSGEAKEFMGEIDNQWTSFVKNAKTYDICP